MENIFLGKDVHRFNLKWGFCCGTSHVLKTGTVIFWFWYILASYSCLYKTLTLFLNWFLLSAVLVFSDKSFFLSHRWLYVNIVHSFFMFDGYNNNCSFRNTIFKIMLLIKFLLLMFCVCVCVCVCVTYVLSTFNLLHFISYPDLLRLPIPVCIPAILRLRCLPCYTLATNLPRSRFPNVVLSLRSRSIPLDLATPGREQWHHCSIRQLCGPRDKGARIRQQPELTNGAVMELLAPWRG